MNQEIARAVEVYRLATRKIKTGEHQGWSKARRDNLLVDGVYAINKANIIKGRK